MNLIKLKIINSINQGESVTQEDIKKYIDTANDQSFLSIIDLFSISTISFLNYQTAYNYVSIITNYYFTLYPYYSLEEQKWITFLSILKVYKVNKDEAQEVVNIYKNLPYIDRDSNFFNQIYEQIKIYMISFFIATNTNYNDLISDINGS